MNDIVEFCGELPMTFYLADGRRVRGELVSLADDALIVERQDGAGRVLIAWHAVVSIEPVGQVRAFIPPPAYRSMP